MRLRRRWLVLATYLILVAASSVVRWRAAVEAPPPTLPRVPVAAAGEVVEIAWREWEASSTPSAGDGSDSLPLVLLHGSPGSHHDFDLLGPTLAADRRVVAPDLPGFGDSEKKLADYSIVTQGEAVLGLLDHLALEKVHLVGFSMGGGSALEIWRSAPERVASITLMGAIGVQELELLGDYHLNHAVHGLQVVAIQAARHLLPHFGLLDRFPLGYEYARNFYDTDQRPLRAALKTLTVPTLIVHGRRDPLVRPEVATEHHRLVPHSEMEMLDASHFFVFTGRPDVAPRIGEFLGRVDAGTAATDDDASPVRRARANEPFDPREIPPWTGLTRLVIMLLLALATLVSEDLTTLGAGLLVADGRLGFLPAALACFTGIYIGDLLLFAAGRFLGRPALALPPLRWWISERDVERSSAWFERRGAAVIFLSRFLPGARLPTYFAAGALRTRFWFFAGYFFLAVAIWTPLLIALSATVGQAALERIGRGIWPALLLLLAGMILLRKLLLPIATWSGRRRLLGAWRRWTRWEFWPPWLFYPPIVLYVLWLGIKHRGLAVFTAANPAIPTGGFIGESKAQILAGLAGAGDALPAWRRLPAALPFAERERAVRAFLEDHDLRLPVVLKPDAGQRGAGVAVVRSAEELRVYLTEATGDLVVQEYVPGEEIGAFYVRRPDEPEGFLFAITEKRMPAVTGDGHATLERLILADPRAVAMADHYLELHRAELDRIPAAGERNPLVELGTHCRGAIFLDGERLKTAALEREIDRISRTFEGFHFGRYDLRAESFEAFAAGGPLRVIELNGVTSEATNIYDPRYSVFQGWKILRQQWRLAFEIGAANRDCGHAPATVGDLWKALREYRRGLK
ncbi:MAG: alpha/beta fold hydrolase [Acidobacteriota bacterium]